MLCSSSLQKPLGLKSVECILNMEAGKEHVLQGDGGGRTEQSLKAESFG